MKLCAHRRLSWGVCVLAIVTLFSSASPAALAAQAAEKAGVFGGEWRTSVGTVTLTQAGKDVTGTYGDKGQFTLKGTANGKKLTFTYQEGNANGEGNWTVDESGNAFKGGFKIAGGRAGEWNGWRPDGKAATGKPVDVAGLWLTDLGLMELEAPAAAAGGGKVTGRFALRGGSDIEGTIAGRQIEFTYKSFRKGKGWFDFAPGGKTFAGAAGTDGFPNWFGWRGRRAPEFVRHNKLVAGKMIDGSTKGLITYAVRAPEGFKEGDGKKWPAVVILHGSNMNARAYVNTIASAWPDVAKDYLLIGFNGEQPSNLGGAGKEPAFNFTYVNFVGPRSTMKGFPGTDRESPALVAEALDELREVYPIEKYFVGGHSQGGFLTYCLLMNFPEKIAGAFPVSAGVIVQAEPGAYAGDEVRTAQRAVPLAIVHGKQDKVVGFGTGEYAATIFGEAGWPAIRFFADDTGAAHMFARLPVDDAIRWLEAQSTDDTAKLLDFAEKRMKAKGGMRDAVAAVNRARSLKLDDVAKARLDAIAREIDGKATAKVRVFAHQLADVTPPGGKAWIDEFLAYRDDFEFAPPAKDLMQTFNTLRAKHDEPAKKLLNEANAAFRQGNRDAGYEKYQEIVEKYYAATSYRNVKRWLAERK